MCRAILTSLQGTPLVNYFPFEKAYDAHQVIGAGRSVKWTGGNCSDVFLQNTSR